MADNLVVNCASFECKASVNQQNDVLFSLCTDLPVGTLVGVMFNRSYNDADGQPSVWVGYWESYTVEKLDDQKNGFSGICSLDESDKLGAAWFKNAHTAISSTISEPVSDSLSVVFTVGGRQKVKAYGKGNRHLSGYLVTKNGDENIVESQASLVCPMNKSYQPRVKRASLA